MEFLDKTGLAYFWGKVKEKLNKKADDDKYQIVTILTNKVKFGNNQTNYTGKVYLNDFDKNNFAGSFPGVYHIACILAVQLCIYSDENAYNNDYQVWLMGNYNILPASIYTSEYDKNNYQEWTYTAPDNVGHFMYGIKYKYTLLLKKD